MTNVEPVVTLAPPPERTWMRALDAQLAALSQVRHVVMTKELLVRDPTLVQFQTDKVLLSEGTPFTWSADALAAITAAGRTIPEDSTLNRWNLPSQAAWWFFERPLEIITSIEATAVRALSLGWIDVGGHRHFVIASWCDPLADYPGIIMPTQMWQWPEDKTFVGMLTFTREHHARLYGPGGIFANKPQLGTERFVDACNQIGRFILAALAWIDQKVVSIGTGHVERHLRKDFNRRTGQQLDGVRIVQLRRLERASMPAAILTEDERREWSCRWTVGGHWRHQACGAEHKDRKLIYVHPYLKGPDDKPYREPSRKIYVVNR